MAFKNMWKPKLNFLGLHYTYIISCSLIAFIIIYAYGNLRAIDAFFFGCSGNTESGLNTVDVKALKTYQQLVLYFFPIITNLGFINIVVVVVRLHWFNKRLRHIGPSLFQPSQHNDVEAKPELAMGNDESVSVEAQRVVEQSPANSLKVLSSRQDILRGETEAANEPPAEDQAASGDEGPPQEHVPRAITWDKGVRSPSQGKTLRIPPPLERDKGAPVEEVDASMCNDEEEDRVYALKESNSINSAHPRTTRLTSALSNVSVERIASSVFVVGDSRRARSQSPRRSTSRNHSNLPSLSPRVTVGRNSTFRNMTAQDWEELGGIEYRSLKLLLKVIIVYFLGMHLLGVICLVPWIHTAPAKYTNFLEAQGQDKTWWAFYSAQTMVDNLGFTLTPDSMIHFADATWPMLIMTFLAYAGNTFYPVLLRLTIWTMSKTLPKKSSLQKPLHFLLDHPRRCYTLLFPSGPTWILFAILLVLNFVDVLLIVVLDLDNPAVTSLAPGPRILAAIFQSASSRHTGTSTFNLADVNPAVQFSLLVMMYISIFPIAMSVRMSNTYEERSLGKYGEDSDLNDNLASTSYLLNHLRNQLSFDLWYIFLGTFCVSIAESDRIADNTDPAFSIFSIMFEVVSGYGNVGLSLGYPTVLTSLCGRFTVFSKLVICVMMIRGRHRGLPYALDRAIILPGVDLVDEGGRSVKND